MLAVVIVPAPLVWWLGPYDSAIDSWVVLCMATAFCCALGGAVCAVQSAMVLAGYYGGGLWIAIALGGVLLLIECGAVLLGVWCALVVLMISGRPFVT
jgi:hypothetical protein